jgi:hypothetical protein
MLQSAALTVSLRAGHCISSIAQVLSLEPVVGVNLLSHNKGIRCGP